MRPLAVLSVVLSRLVLARALATPTEELLSSVILLQHPSADTPSPTEITINNVRTGGTGCPRKSVSTDISPDRTVVTLGFDEFQTYRGRGRRREDGDKNCRITLGLHYPGGYTMAVVQTTYHGFAQLDQGVTGTFESGYSFEDEGGRNAVGGREATVQSSIQGGGSWSRGQVYTKTDTVPASKVVRSPCGQNVRLTIRTHLSLTGTNDTAEGTLTGDDATISFTQQVNINWQKCNM